MASAPSTEKLRKGDSANAAGLCAPVQLVGKQLAVALLEISRTFERCGVSIWSEAFKPDRLPLAFLHNCPDGAPVCWAYNLTLHAPVLGHVAVANGHTLTAYDGHDVEPVDGGFEIGRELASQECVLFDLDGEIPQVSETEFRRFVIHETFHFFQLFIERWKTPVGFDPFSQVGHLPIDEFLGDLEVELLESAVLADDSEFQLLVSRFCQTRNHRHGSHKRGLLMSQEGGLEQIEGTARYVENRYAEANGRPGRLALPPEATDSRSDWHSAGRFYRTGARIGEILDRLGADWRPRLAIGQTPAEILSEVEQARSADRLDQVADSPIDLRSSIQN